MTETQIPTDKPNEKKKISISSLIKIPIIIEIKWPKKIFLGWANLLSWKTNRINAEEPKENTSHTPNEASKVSNANKEITKPAEKPLTNGSIFLIFSYSHFLKLGYIELWVIKALLTHSKLLR